MRAISPQRRLSMTRNTNYPSLHERRLSETGYKSQANIKSMGQEYEANRNRIENMHIKSIIELDNQRKQLEKSMLAYTEKMKEMKTCKARLLFGGMHIRLADIQAENGPLSLPARADLCETSSTVSSNSSSDSSTPHHRRVLTDNYIGDLPNGHELKTKTSKVREKVIKQTNTSKGTVKHIPNNVVRNSNNLQNNNNTQTEKQVRHSYPDVTTTTVKHNLTGRRFSKALKKEKEVVNDIMERNDSSDYLRDSPSSINNSSAIHRLGIRRKSDSGNVLTSHSSPTKYDKTCLNPVVPNQQREGSFIEGLCTDTDSAYSSCNEDSSLTSEHSACESDSGTESSIRSKRKVRFVDPNPLDGNLLTLPNIYKR